MEYFSDVQICIKKRDFKNLKRKLLKIKSNILEILDIYNEFIISDGTVYVRIGWNSIEWNLIYKDVFIIEKTLKKLKTRDIYAKVKRKGVIFSDN